MTTPTPRDFRLFRLADELRELTTPIGKEAATILERQAMTLLQFHADLAAAQEALENIETSLRRAGATLPAPESTGTIEGAMSAGLCIALCVVVDERERAMGAAVSGGGEIIDTASSHANSSVATHSKECPPHEQKQSQPAINEQDIKELRNALIAAEERVRMTAQAERIQIERAQRAEAELAERKEAAERGRDEARRDAERWTQYLATSDSEEIAAATWGGATTDTTRNHGVKESRIGGNPPADKGDSSHE